MSKAEEKNDKRADEEEAIPTASFGAGVVGPGGEIGPYKLLSILGEGGFAVVYLAEQQKPVKRRVALKVIKPGMDSKQVIARFEAERQALALLDHPNIAYVFNAGTTEAERPYFVMEYVKGVPLTEHCDRQKLSIEERLGLFLLVCEGVQHAHQKGIIHRDIKPSNVLVSIEDEKTVPKIIDFGVAKAIAQPLTERTLFTEQGQLIGTPEYMSPEQAEMTAQDIDTRSDIYSLGVMLYELLTGVLPFEAETLREGGFEHIRQVIREEEPKTPSTRLSTLGGEESTRLAQRRRADVGALQRRLRGDLDWITLKAMEKDRTRRYLTAHAFAEDIQRHLSHEPVLAGPPSTVYKIKKFVRRNRASVTAAATVAAAIVLGFIVSTALYFQADQARKKETIARTQAEQARQKETAARAEAVTARDEAEQSEKNAEEQRQLAVERELTARQYLYMARIGLAQESWESGNVAKVLDLLNSLRPELGQDDLRGFEWYYLWRQCHAHHTTLYGHIYGVKSVAFSPDGKVLATGGSDGTIKLWDVERREEIRTLEGHTAEMRPKSLAFSPDGKTLVSGTWDHTVRIWDTATGTERFKLPRRYVCCVAISSDGLLAVGDWYGRTTIWDTHNAWQTDDSWQRIAPFEMRRNGGEHLSFSPDGSVLAIAGGESFKPSDVRLWDTQKRQWHTTILRGHESKVRFIAFSPDGKLIATASHDRTVRLWDTTSGQELAVGRSHWAPLHCVVFSPDGKKLATGSSDNTIRLWERKTLKEIGRLQGHTGQVRALSFSPCGEILASASMDGTVKLWTLAKQRAAETRLVHESSVCSMAFLPNDKRIVTGSEDGSVALWDTANCRQVWRHPGHDGPVWSVAVSPDGNKVATGGGDRTVKLWDSITGDSLATHTGHAVPHAVVFSPDSATLAVKWEDMSLTFWDLVEGKTQFAERTGVASGHRNPVSSAVFSPDGETLAYGGTYYGKTHFWDVASGQALNALSGHALEVWSVAFSPDGTLLATASEDKTLMLWDFGERQVRAVFSGHAGPVWCVAFSPDDRFVASGSIDKTVRLWDVGLGTQRAIFSGHEDPVTSVAFSSDGNILASASKDGSVILWRAATETEADEHPSVAQYLYAKAVESGERGDYNKAVLLLQKALPVYRKTFGETHALTIRTMNLLAWWYATCPVSQVRNGRKAVELATKVYELTKNPVYLDTLAAAYAEIGDFEAAVKWQKTTIALLEEKGQLSQGFKTRLRLYESGKPHREGILWSVSSEELVARWKFDSVEGPNIPDLSGNGFIAKLMGTACTVKDAERGVVLSLDGEGFVDCGDHPAFDVGGPITVAAWVKARKLDMQWQTIVTKGDSAWRIARDKNRDSLQFACGRASSGVIVRGNVNINDGQWHCVVGVFDGKKIRLYIDGMLDASANALQAIGINSHPVYIGANAEQPGRCWNGLIDDVRIYSYALDEAQIKSLYLETLGSRASTPSPLHGKSVGKPTGPIKLSWAPARDAIAYKVYFGTDSNNLSLLDTVKDVTSIQSPELRELQEYFWRVDTVKSDGSVVKGNLWSFSTGKMVGWWKFDGDATDSSGYGRDGNEIGNPTYAPGISGQALALRGDGDHVLVSDAGACLNGLDALTVCLWVKSNVTGTDKGFIIFENPAGQDDRAMRYDAAGSYGGGTNLIKCGVTSDAVEGPEGWPGRQQVESSSNVQTSDWQHLAMTWSSGNRVALYINGKLDRPTWVEPAKVGTLIGYTKLIIGKGGKDMSGDGSWNGLIDDVRIYSYALSEAEIKALYAGKEPRPNRRLKAGKF